MQIKLSITSAYTVSVSFISGIVMPLYNNTRYLVLHTVEIDMLVCYFPAALKQTQV